MVATWGFMTKQFLLMELNIAIPYCVLGVTLNVASSRHIILKTQNLIKYGYEYKHRHEKCHVKTIALYTMTI